MALDSKVATRSRVKCLRTMSTKQKSSLLDTPAKQGAGPPKPENLSHANYENLKPSVDSEGG